MRLVVPELMVPELALVSFAQLITPWALAVSLPELVKPVQSRVERVRPPDE